MKIIGKTDTGYITEVTNQELRKLTGITEPPELGAEFPVLEVWKIISDIRRESPRALTAAAVIDNYGDAVVTALNDIKDVLDGEE